MIENDIIPFHVGLKMNDIFDGDFGWNNADMVENGCSQLKVILL